MSKLPETLHCSALPRILACPASMIEPQVRIEPADDEVSRVGRAVHKALAEYVRSGDNIAGDCAKEFGVSPKEVGFLCHVGRQQWDDYGSLLHGVEVERSLEAPLGWTILAGTPDIEARDEHDDIVIWDWKTGRIERDYDDQLMAYCMLASDANLQASDRRRAWIITARLQDDILDTREVSDQDMLAFFHRLYGLRKDFNTYRPDADTCMYCPRRFECEARAEVTANAVRSIATQNDMGDLPAKRLAELYPKSKALKKALEDYDAALRAQVAVHGPMPLGDGTEVYLDEGEREFVCAETALRCFSGEVVIPSLSASKAKLLQAISDQAPRGMKKQAKDDAMEILRKAGGVTVTPTRTLRTRKVESEEE